MNNPRKPARAQSYGARNMLFALLALFGVALACNLPPNNRGQSPANDLTAMASARTKTFAGIDVAIAQTQTALRQQEEQLQLTVTALAAQNFSPNNAACQWIVAGIWQTTSSNNYHPFFYIKQEGATLSGMATLSANEAALAGYSGTVGKGTGSVAGNVFTFAVAWPPRKSNGEAVSETYTGAITEGKIEGKVGSETWSGTGPSKCVNP
jgi:hypothetical protein